MPTECHHRFVIDWGDFGPCEDCLDHDEGDCPNLADCPDCTVERASSLAWPPRTITEWIQGRSVPTEKLVNEMLAWVRHYRQSL